MKSNAEGYLNNYIPTIAKRKEESISSNTTTTNNNN